MKKLLILVVALLVSMYVDSKAAGVQSVTTIQEFNSNLNKPLTVVMFGSESCPHCRKMRPIFNQVAQQMGNVSFVFVEAFGKALSDLLYQYNVKGVPTFKIIKNGNVVDTLGGEQTKAALENFIKNNQ